MYNLIIYLYLFGVAVYSRFNEKVRKMWRGEREAFRILREKVDPHAKYVWFHAASLGEFEQGRPLMERLRREHPEYKILLTFFSPSGYEVRKNYEGADIITYLPLDTITNARRFLRTISPVMAFFIKYEFWYNYLHILKHRNIPVYSVSSIFRPDQVFFKWYGRQYSRVLNCFTHFYVQNEISKELLAKIGIKEVTVVGDTRFDRVLKIKEAAKQLKEIEYFCQYNIANDPDDDDIFTACAGYTPPKGVFVAGSSWSPDEDIFIRYFLERKLFDYGKWKLIIAPHVIDESHLAQIVQKLNTFASSTVSACSPASTVMATSLTWVVALAWVFIISWRLLSGMCPCSSVPTTRSSKRRRDSRRMAVSKSMTMMSSPGRWTALLRMPII